MKNLLKQGEHKSIQRIKIHLACKHHQTNFKVKVFQSNKKIRKPQFIFATLTGSGNFV